MKYGDLTKEGLVEVLDKLCITANSLKEYEGIVVFVGFVKRLTDGKTISTDFNHAFYRYNFDIECLPLFNLILNKIIEKEIQKRLK